ncbi:DoxX family protein [Streptomyces spinoverrucosus]|uniref:DoxX family protein n=1 Tax=Streptomyces spinoverrucosus TaxID=284043 RepID=UPI0018C3A0DF|nr:DoxX family protein [Streptomyces spinoverrucosus]MBG0855610.1 DoxX family protein [Streptomyces spinoverrucosus]
MTARLNSAQPYVLGLFRIVIGLLFLCHGAAKLFGVLGGADGQGGTVSVGTWPTGYSGVIELVGGALVMLGLGTRAAAFIASGAMAYAYFKVHQPGALWPMENGGESAALFCWAMFLLVFTGSGALGLDALFARRGGAERSPETSKEAQQSPLAA